MSQPFVGQIMIFGFDFAPRNWALCNGQLLAIQQNTALFSILGTTYGGNGTTTFALPDLRGRVPMQWGPGAGPVLPSGLTQRTIGEVGGQETVTLLQTQMPQHTHTALASSVTPAVGVPTGNAWATGGTAAYAATANTTMATGALPNAGSNQAHENRAPLLALNYCIALFGIFPSRN
jgi:microcystin-dependent protein